MQLSATVILFHPSADVIKNINSYLGKIDKLYVIDNSEQKDVELLQQIKGLSPKCILLINPENYGIATALNQAVKMAIHDRFEWLLTMDQDSSFENNSYFNEFFKYENKNKIALFAPEIHEDENPIDRNGKIDFVTINDIAYTSGSIIKLKTCQDLGGFNEKLFIDAVDTDYCIRLLKAKHWIIRIKGAILNHKLGEMKIIFLPFNKKIRLYQHSALRQYYITRNHSYILFKYLTSHPKIVLLNYYKVLKKFILTLLFQKDRIKVIKYTSTGLFHFIINRYGKYE